MHNMHMMYDAHGRLCLGGGKYSQEIRASLLCVQIADNARAR